MARSSGTSPSGEDTFPKILLRNASAFGDRTAFREKAYGIWQSWTWSEVCEEIRAFSIGLKSLGLETGDKIAIVGANRPRLYWSMVAAQALGAVPVPVYSDSVAEEMAYVLGHAEVKFAVVEDQEQVDKLLSMSDEVPTLKDVIYDEIRGLRDYDHTHLHSYETIQEKGRSLQAENGGLAGEWEQGFAGGKGPDVAVMLYTSGTTGFPKGAQLTHRGCVANLLNMQYAATSAMLAVQAATGAEPPANMPIPVALITTPLFHVTANNCGAYRVTAVGGTIVLMYRWDAGEALRLIEREGVTSAGGVPVMGRELINHPDFEKTDTSSLLAIPCGGAQVPPDQVLDIDDRVQTARPGTGYGMTEVCGIITSVAGDFFVDKPDSAGPAMPNFEVKCVDDDGNEVPTGELGELWVRGSSVIKGYINRPEATAESITDGWLHTGDIGRMDEHGFIFLVDRKKDMVLRGGENIYCVEVEAAIYHHSAIAECCVFGVPDERLGEEVGVAIFMKPGESITEDALKSHCASRLSKFKIPRYVWFYDQPFPRNASGKFLKREVRDQLVETLQS